ncbi:hypothetical protein CEQ90_17905 [Lewinellaceae bacterium SD302]|nr:hypothetical protein CEQ90_17905 [Lewinellaceae bacterium SD302]
MNISVLFAEFSDNVNAQDYVERKWAQVPKEYIFPYDDMAIRSYLFTQSEDHHLAVTTSADQFFSLSADQLAIFSSIAEAYMPLLKDEEKVRPDELHLVAEDGLLPSGTLTLIRSTNHAKLCFYFNDKRIIDGTFYYSPLEDKVAEEKIRTISNSKLWEEFSPKEIPSEANTQAEIISTAIIASTILTGLLSGAATEFGSKAMSWALQQLGIFNPIGEQAALTYEQLREALKIQAREVYRQKIRVEFNEYQRKLDDYNNGARTIEQLNSIYAKSLRLVSVVQEDERHPDRVLYLAFVMAAYLAIMQERAEWYRGKDDEKFKSFYNAFKSAAAREMKILKKVRTEAEAYRRSKVTDFLRRRNFWGPLVYFEDVITHDHIITPPNNWHYYEEKCIRRGPRYHCIAWSHDTPSYWAQIKKLEVAKAGYIAQLNKEVAHALRGLDETYEKMQRIVDMEIPTSPPK